MSTLRIPGLVGHWKFDEEKAVACADSSSSNNHGTLVGSPTRTAPAPRIKFGTDAHSMTFNGSSQYITIADSSSLEGNAFSICAWVKVLGSGNGATSVIWSNGDWNGTNCSQLFRLLNATNSLQIYTTNSAGTTFGGGTGLTVTVDGLWHHVAFTSNGTTIIGYKDGVAGATTYNITGTLKDPNYTKAIGVDNRLGGATGQFNGQIDDVRVYNVALTAAEVAELYTGRQGKITDLVGWWTMDGWGNAHDSSGYGNDGTWVGSPTTTSSVSTKFQYPNPYAITLNGSSQYVQMPSAVIPASGAFTVSMWAKPTSGATAGNDSLFGQYHNVFANRLFAIFGTTRVYVQIGSNSLGFANTYLPNVWYHIVMGRDVSGNGFIYVNASLVANGTLSGTVDNQALTVGGFDEGVNVGRFNGSIDDVRIYSRALTADEVAILAAGRN
jgi:hypothetical protein